ncbi:MAG: hypothetical protein AAF846_21645 [Chloroflexota bacterium]
MTVQGLLEGADYLIHAQVIEIDDRAQNAILRVNNYLAGGSGPEYILLSNSDPIHIEYILAGRSSGSDCLGISAEYNLNESLYLFVDRTSNGSYSIVAGAFNSLIYRFPQPDSTVEVYLEGGWENGGQVYENIAERNTGQDVTELEFINIIKQESQQESAEPLSDSRYPLKAPLLITTTTQQYIMPIDWQHPVSITEETFSASQHPLYYYGFSDAIQCAETDNYIISPDNLNIAVFSANNSVCFSWASTVVGDNYVSGEAILFSELSNTVAVWNSCELSIYTTGYPRLIQSWYELELINQRTLEGVSCVDFHNMAVWHPNGRYLAYSDATGIHLWDTMNASEKSILLIPKDSENPAVPNHFSPLGNYLNYTVNGTTEHMEILFGQTYPNGLFSPDESVLINFDSEPTAFGYEICNALDDCSYGARDMFISFFDEATGEVVGIYFPTEIIQTEWIDDTTFIQLSCDADEEIICGVFRWYPAFHGWSNSRISNGYAYDYDHENESIAIVQDETTLYINSEIYPLMLSDDEKVESIEWLSSLFYRD